MMIRFSLLSFCTQPTHPLLAQTGLNLVLRRKALGIEALMIQRRVVWKSTYAAQKPMIQKLAEVQSSLAHTALAGPGAQAPGIYQQQISAL
jgi:hypothetical protein